MPDAAEFYRIKAKYYDPADRTSLLFYKDPTQCVRLHFAIVEDNKDPGGKGRLKLFFPQWGDNIVTGWVPFARPYAGSGGGFWAFPDVGDQVLCIFINDNPSKPIALGCMYTPRVKPPVEDNSGNNLKVFTTRTGSKIIFDDTGGAEKLIIHTKDGEMRIVLDKANGLFIVNEKGDINIKCRKLTLRAGDAAGFTISKELKMICDRDKLIFDASRGMSLKSGKDAVLKGAKIKLKGSSGVTAGVKQIAKKDDQVLGVDLHDIQVPSSSGLVTVPAIPHPYLGKLADKLSDDVTVNDKAAAVKGSKSKFSTPGHIPMPPGVKFAANPNNEGEVSSGTEASVKINGKEAAVLGSMVKTCSDPQPRETCVIVAVGVSVPLPIMLPGMDPDQFEKDGGTVFNTRDPVAAGPRPIDPDQPRVITNVQWGSTKIKAGEEVTLTAGLSNQYDGANVYFSIWPDGADMDNDPPEKKLTGKNEGGSAEVKTRLYRPEKRDKEDELKYFFTAKSFSCEKKKSGNLTVEKIKPVFSSLKWLKEGSDISGARLGEQAVMEASVQNLDDEEKVQLRIYNKDYQNDKDYLFEGEAEVKDGKVVFEWPVTYYPPAPGDEDERVPGANPEYLFIAAVPEYHVESDPGPNLKLLVDLVHQVVDAKGNPLPGVQYFLTFADKSTRDGQTDSKGYIKEEDVPFGPVNIEIEA